ncbi:MAG TPA: gluconokinase [Gammaproteobacteria bacterium]|nr:gluconokinase [Gammaproteobacteria bacterium]
MSGEGARHARIVVVMGVSGAGKTTIGKLLARRLGWPFADADEFHSAANIAKMHSGVALDDADRKPWLEAIARRIDAWRDEGRCGVVTCSALKRRYRDIVIGDRPDVRLVYLRGEQALIAGRLVARHGHFMPSELLASQYAALEEPTADERPITIEIDKSPEEQVDEIAAALGRADDRRKSCMAPRDGLEPPT